MPEKEGIEYASSETIPLRKASLGDSLKKSSVGHNNGAEMDGIKAVVGAAREAPDSKTASGQRPDTVVQLRKVLGLRNGVGLIVGNMIGSGIFVSPTTVVQYTGSVGMALVVWVATGLVSTMGALCYAELGTTIPKSGGNYTYILEAFGPLPAFLVLWTNFFIAKPFARAIVSITFANYLLQVFLPDCSSPPYYAVRLLAAALLCLIAYINCIGVKLGSRVQDSLALTKVVALFIIIVAGVQHLARGHVEYYVDPMKGTVWDVASFATAFYSTLFAYNGWNSLNYIAEELKTTDTTMPRAIAISMGIVTVIYTLTNVAYYAVLTPAEILSSNAVAVTFGNRMLGVLAWIIAFFVACSTAGNTNGGLMIQSRTVYAGAREGHFPKFLALIDDNATPVTAVMFTAVIPLVALMADNVGGLLAYTSFSNNLINLTAVLGLLWLRYKEPNRQRPFKVWLGFPVMYLMVNVFLAVFPIVRRPVEVAVALVTMTSGLLVYYFCIYRTKPRLVSKIMGKLTLLCQVVFMCSPEEKCE